MFRTTIFATLCFALSVASICSGQSDSSVRKTPTEPDALTLGIEGRDVLKYQAAYIPSPDEKAPWFGRSGFIHPFLTPSGKVVTEPFPSDHLHQHGIMFAWTSSVIGGKKVDFWNSRLQQGHIEHANTLEASASKLVVKLRHVNDRPSPPEPVIEERWEIEVVPHEDYHVFDLTSTQEIVLDEPIEIAKYHYGSMCIRGPTAWLDKTIMTTSEGKNQQTGNHSRPNWVAMSGEEQTYGLAAMSHPENFRSPQHVRLHPSKPYFCFVPMVEEGFEIKPDAPYRSRFRFVAFDGKMNAQALNAIWKDFAAQ